MRRFDAQSAGGGRVGNHSRLPVLAAVWVVVALATLPTLLVHNGSTHNVLLLAASFAAVLTVLVLRPFSAFFAALVFFLGMGLWVKFVFHMITGTPFIEPVGDFRPTVAAWDEVLVVSSVALLGIAAAMLLDWRLGGPLPAERAEIGRSPTYRRIEPWLAIASVLVALACFASNWYYGFVKYGVDHVVILPRPVHIAVTFVVLWGAALWLACMGFWAWSGNRLSMTALLVLGMVQGLLAGVSNASRARYVFHAMAFGLGWIALLRDKAARLGPLRMVVLAALGAALLALSLFLVSLDRIVMYQTGATAAQLSQGRPIPFKPGSGAEGQDGKSSKWSSVVTNETAAEMAGQISRLFVSRWIGLEGVMSVVAYDGKGAELLWQGVTESPTIGNDGLYEKISKSTYVKLPGLTFLTTAGSVAILYYSGSVLVVFLGIFGLSLAGVWSERLASRLTASPMAGSVVAVAVANFIAQVNQPYVPFVFTLEMLGACAMVFVFRKLVVRLDRGRNPAGRFSPGGPSQGRGVR